MWQNTTSKQVFLKSFLAPFVHWRVFLLFAWAPLLLSYVYYDHATNLTISYWPESLRKYSLYEYYFVEACLTAFFLCGWFRFLIGNTGPRFGPRTILKAKSTINFFIVFFGIFVVNKFFNWLAYMPLQDLGRHYIGTQWGYLLSALYSVIAIIISAIFARIYFILISLVNNKPTKFVWPWKLEKSIFAYLLLYSFFMHIIKIIWSYATYFGIYLPLEHFDQLNMSVYFSTRNLITDYLFIAITAAFTAELWKAAQQRTESAL